MKKLFAVLLSTSLAIGFGGCAINDNVPKDVVTEGKNYDLSPKEIQYAVSQVKPALVRIKVVTPSYWDGRENKQVAFGSGTIIDKEGHVVTNHHVAGDAVQIFVTLANREEVEAKLIGTDPATDIAVIQLTPDEPMDFPTAHFGDSETVQVGDPVMALGSPLSISQSVTLGIISNTDMITPPAMRGYEFELDGENVGELVKWFGHDAAIYGGNSGGPLINLNGEIIGVNEIGMGLGGAIPGNLAKQVAQTLIEQGEVKRAYLGMTLQPLLDSSTLKKGVLISSVMKDSPASKAGIQEGDILLAVAGETVVGRFDEELPAINKALVSLPIGEESPLTVYRGGEEKEVPIVPEERDPAMLPTKELRPWGMTARNLTRRTKLDLALESQTGVIVTSTRSGGPASKAKPELRPLDVILSINGEKIDSVEQLQNLTEGIIGESEEFFPVLVKFEREGETTLTVIEIGIDQLQDPGKEVVKAWIPMETQVLTREIAKQLELEKTQGVRVTRVYDEDSPFKAGDILTHFDDMEIEASRPVDADVFETLVRQYKIGTEVPVKFLRNGEEMRTAIVLKGSPEKQREMKRYRDLLFEFIARNAAFKDKTKPAFEGVKVDVVIDSVTSGGWADLAGLGVGDVLLKIDDHEISDVKDVERLMDTVREDQKNAVVFFVRRGTRNLFLELKPNWEKE